MKSGFLVCVCAALLLSGCDRSSDKAVDDTELGYQLPPGETHLTFTFPELPAAGSFKGRPAVTFRIPREYVRFQTVLSKNGQIYQVPLQIELPGPNDTVQTSVTLTLGSNVENIVLLGSSAIHGTGNTLNNQLTGNSGANSLSGAAGNDTLRGMAGSDTLIGGAGNDTYLLGRGDGAETVQENDSTSGNTDILRFLEDVSVEQVWFRRVSNNLEVSIIGTGDRASITNWYSGNQYRLEQFQVSDGQALLMSQVENLVNAMAAFSPPPMGQTTLTPAEQASLAPTIAANWN